MYGYVYLTTNLINGKKYVGQHKSSKFDKNYKGSGKLLRKAIRKYGKSNFKVEMIESCNNFNQLNSREAYWIVYYDAVNSNDFYNLKNHDYIDEKGNLHGTPSYIWINNGIEEKIISYSDLYKEDLKGWYTGRLYRERYAKNINEERHCVNNGKEDRVIFSDQLEEFLNNGYIEGRIPCRWITKDNVTKYVLESKVDDYLKDGWIIGRNLEEGSVGLQKGKVFMTNGTTNVMITPDKISYYESKGFQKGFVHHKVKKKKIWVNNGQEHTQINPEELKEYEDRGYVRGMLKKKSKQTRIFINNGVKTFRVFLNELDEYLKQGFVEGRLNRPTRKDRKTFK